MTIFIFLQSAGVIVIPNLSNIRFSLTKMNWKEQTLSQHFRLIVIHQTNEMDQYCILATLISRNATTFRLPLEDQKGAFMWQQEKALMSMAFVVLPF
jgi:hypothetical protein